MFMKRLGDRRRRRLRERSIGRRQVGEKVHGPRGAWIDSEIRGLQRQLAADWVRAERLIAGGADPSVVLKSLEKTRLRLEGLISLVKSRS